MESRVTYPDLQMYPGVRNAVLVDRHSRVNFAEIGKKKYPSGAILHFNVDLGFTDQTGNQQAVLIGSAYPSVVAGYAINADGREWGFDLSAGAVRTAFLAGEVTVVMQVTMPAMSSLTDATDYSLWGDVLFVRRDGTSGSFKLSDGTNTATVAHGWDDGEVVTVVCQCDGDVMRIGIVYPSGLPLGIECGTAPIGWWGDSLTLGYADDGLRYYGNVLNYGVGGETSTQIKTRLLASTMVGDVVVIWAGNNNPLPYSTVLADVASMVADIGHDKYLIVGMLINAIHAAGNSTKTAVIEGNAALSALYGPKFLDMLEYLKTEYDPENPQDVIDVSNGITPSSLRGDDIHLNATGQNLAAKKIYDTIVGLGYVSGVEYQGVSGNCLTVTNANAGSLGVKIYAPEGFPEITVANVSKIQNGGTCGVRVVTNFNGVENYGTAGTLWNIRITLTDGRVIVFPVSEGAGTTIYGYVEGDGAVYTGMLFSGVAQNTYSTLWAASQNVYLHDKAYGHGLVAVGQLGPERIINQHDREFSDNTGKWTIGTDWAIGSDVASHFSTNAGFLSYYGLSVLGSKLRTSFSVVGYSSGIIGLGGGNVAGGFYKTTNGDFVKDYDSVGPNLIFYATGVASLDNVSVREIYTDDARIPANPYNPGYDCAGNPLVAQPERPGFGPWATCDASLPTDGQVFKYHTLPIAAKKLTVFPGVASASQIAEAVGQPERIYTIISGDLEAFIATGIGSLVIQFQMTLARTLLSSTRQYPLGNTFLSYWNDGATGKWALSDGTSESVVDFDWIGDQIVTVSIDCDGHDMLIGVE